MHQKRKAFTLVELIIVIIILAILWTIAYLSLQWYSSSARDTKRISNLWNISNVLNFNIVKANSIKWFILDQTNTISWHIYWWTDSILWTNYNVWTLNYEGILIKEDDFLDPNWKKYILWYSTLYQSKYQITATIENEWMKIAKVTWNYNPRLSINTQSDILSWEGTKYISLKSNNWIKQEDTIITDWTPNKTLKVISISNSNLWKKVHLSWNTPIDSTYIKLKLDDTPWLVADKDNNTKAIIEWWNYLPY